MTSMAADQFLNFRSKLTIPPSLFTTTSKCQQISSQNPNKPSSSLFSSRKNQAIFHHVTPSLIHIVCGNGGGGGDGAGAGGGGGGENEDGFWKKLLLVLPAADENDSWLEWDVHGLYVVNDTFVKLDQLSETKTYKVSEIVFVNSKIGVIDDFYSEMLGFKAGGIYTKVEILNEVETLTSCGIFKKLELQVNAKTDGTIGLNFLFTDVTWKKAEKFKCINVGLNPIDSDDIVKEDDMTWKERFLHFQDMGTSYRKMLENASPCMLPNAVHKEVMHILTQGKKNVTAKKLLKVKDKVNKWYRDEGYVCAQVVMFQKVNDNEVVCEVVEGDITEVVFQFQDDSGNQCHGKTDYGLLKRALPKKLRKKNVFNVKARNQALRNMNSLSLFSRVEVNPLPDSDYKGGVVVEIKLTEVIPKSTQEVEQKPTHVRNECSIVVGRGGFNTLTLDDVAFQLVYANPLLDFIPFCQSRTVRSILFSHRKLSPVFTGGPGVDEVPPVRVDRTGITLFLTENGPSKIKPTYGVVIEEIRHDQNGHISLSGESVPSSVSDRMVYFHANAIRDNTKFVNGAIVGNREAIQFDQEIGISSKFQHFNRLRLMGTRFIQLKEVASKLPPPVLVIHGNCDVGCGDHPSFGAFTVGGPCSVRGYNIRNIGDARYIYKLAVEMGVQVKDLHVYGFAGGNDLGAAGHGFSYGGGVKLWLLKAEYSKEHNTGTGAFFLRFGENI